MDVVSQMVDAGQPGSDGRLRPGRRNEIDIVDRVLAIAVDEVNQAAADPLDGRNIELHRPDLAVHRLGAERDRALIRLGRIGHTECDRTNRGAVQPGKGLGKALGLGIQDEIDIALLVERHVFRTVARRGDKPHALEQGGQGPRVGAGIFDKLEPVRPHRIVPQITPRFPRHRDLPSLYPRHVGAPRMLSNPVREAVHRALGMKGPGASDRYPSIPGLEKSDNGAAITDRQ